MGLNIYKIRSEEISKISTANIFYDFWDNMRAGENTFYINNIDELNEELLTLNYTKDQKQEIVDIFNKYDLFGVDIEIT